jgi:TRAP-type transport system periplasmic protein
MVLSRTRFAAGAASAPLTGILRYPADAAEFTYKLGDDLPANHAINVHATEAADKVRRESGGRLDIHIFPNSLLGGASQMIPQLRVGAIEFLLVGDNILASVVPLAAMSGVPFAFSSYNDAWNTMQGPLGRYIRNTTAAANLHTLEASWDGAFRQMINGVRPIASPEDLKGLKMRIPQAPMPVAMFKAFGASPTPIDSAEMYTALQTHLVDGLDNTLPGTEAFKLYEVQKYVAMTNHIWSGWMLHANLPAWQRLPKGLRDLTERYFNAAAISERVEVSRQDAGFERTLGSQGMIFNRPSVLPFRTQLKASGVYLQWRDSFGPDAWTLLEKSVGKLT